MAFLGGTAMDLPTAEPQKLSVLPRLSSVRRTGTWSMCAAVLLSHSPVVRLCYRCSKSKFGIMQKTDDDGEAQQQRAPQSPTEVRANGRSRGCGTDDGAFPEMQNQRDEIRFQKSQTSGEGAPRLAWTPERGAGLWLGLLVLASRILMFVYYCRFQPCAGRTMSTRPSPRAEVSHFLSLFPTVAAASPLRCGDNPAPGVSTGVLQEGRGSTTQSRPGRQAGRHTTVVESYDASSFQARDLQLPSRCISPSTKWDHLLRYLCFWKCRVGSAAAVTIEQGKGLELGGPPRPVLLFLAPQRVSTSTMPLVHRRCSRAHMRQGSRERPGLLPQSSCGRQVTTL